MLEVLEVLEVLEALEALEVRKLYLENRSQFLVDRF